MRFEFAQYLTKEDSFFHKKSNNGIAIPMRVMFGTILRETPKAYYIEVYGKPEPGVRCLHCLRKLTHKVSQYYGLGPICGKHYYITNITEENIEQHFEDIRIKMADIVWRGLVPKKDTKVTTEDFHTIQFVFKDVLYKTVTSDKTKVEQIYTKSSKIVSDVVVRA